VGEIEVCHLALGLGIEAAGRKTGEFYCCSPESVISRIHANSILIVGRIIKNERWKGHDELISAWPLVVLKVPNAQLVVVGGGDDIPRLRALAEQLDVSASILFTGHVDDRTLQQIYSRVAAFAMPSRAEGFGIVYLEAMHHRLPCIGSVRDAAREIIVDGETGFLVDQSDRAELAAKVILLLTDPFLRARMGYSGFERLRTSFSLEQFQVRMRQVFEKLSA